MYSALFANDIVAVILGPKWAEAAIIFRLMTPAVLVIGIINPLAWLLVSIGMQKRSLHVGFVISPLVIASYLIGLPYGPTGVAFSYSVVLTLWLFPHVAWCVHGTPVSIKDLARAIAGPFLSGIVAAICAFEVQRQFGYELRPVLRLALGGAAMGGVYGWMLIFALGHRKLYLDVLVSLRQPSRLDA
jgi:PST family polysaccharide transporter